MNLKIKEETIANCKVRHCTIEGYEFHATLLPVSQEWTFTAPFGDNLKDKEMFDKLVYHNKNLYNGRDFYRVVENIRTFILNNQ